MIAEFENRGIWFLPNKPDEKISGILKYTPEKGVLLELIGAFLTEQNEFELILGEIESGKAVTLYNSYIINHTFSATFNVSTIFSNFAFVGEQITKISKLKFQKAVVYLKYLDEWVNKREEFKIDMNEKEHSVAINYKLPKGIETNVNKKFKLIINPTVTSPSWNIVQKEAKITQRISCIFNYIRKRSFGEILEDISHFENFLTLCSQRATYPIEFHMFNKDADNRFTKQLDVYHQVTIDKTVEKDLIPYDFLVQFRNIEDSFGIIMNKWYASQVTLQTCYIPFFNNYYEKHLYTSDKFLNVCRALEAFHRDTVGVNDPTTSKEYHYKKRVVEVFDSVSSCFNFLLKIRDKKKFAEKIKNYRNDFTHSNPVQVDINKKFLKTYYLTEKLTIIMSVVCITLLHRFD